MMTKFPMMAEWNIKQYDADNQLVHEETKKNLIVNKGREDVLWLLFALSGSGQAITSMAVGACSTSATVNDTRLNYEYIATSGGSTRYDLTNTDGDPLSAADVVTDVYVDTSETPNITYYRKIVVQATIPTGDPNVNQPFQEYGLVTNTSTPATPTSTSGYLFNHLVAASAIIKDATTQIVVTVTLRI